MAVETGLLVVGVSAIFGTGVIGAFIRGYGTQRVHTKAIIDLESHEEACMEDRRQAAVTMGEIKKDVCYIKSGQDEMKADIKILLNGRGK